MTNADKIRNMTDEELNQFLWRWKINSIAGFLTHGGAEMINAKEQRIWLKEEEGKTKPAEIRPFEGEEVR